MRNRFLIILLLNILYEFLMTLLRPTGVNLTKIAITLLPWFSFSLAFEYFFNKNVIIKRKVPCVAFNIFIALTLFNFINIFRGVLADSGSITTVFGNPYNSLALLTPFAMCFGLAKGNLIRLNRFFLYSTATGIIPALLVISAFSGYADNFLSATLVLVSPVIFLIGTMPYQTRTNKLIIYVGSLLLFGYVGVLNGSRATLLRILLLYLSNMAVFFYEKFKARWLLAIAMCTLLLPYVMVMMSFDRNQSVFLTATQYLQSEFRGKGYEDIAITKSDTRTFLYQEVYRDLERNGKLLLGKGSNGTYYSSFFHGSRGDSDTRLTVEVGVLDLLLKGGIVTVILNLAILNISIFFAFFRANNQYVRWVGFMLVVHTLILFAENLVCYNMYNFAVWFFVGVCLSKEIRAMSNREVQATFNRMPRIFPRVNG